MRHLLSKNGDIKFVHSLSPRGFEAQRADGARLHFPGRDGTQLWATRVADDPLDALGIELAYAVGVISQSPGSRRSRAPWVSVPSESPTPKVLNNSRYHVHEHMYNAFGVNVVRILCTQGARLRRDPGLWSRTASR